jgi:outer membrane protein, heavy metal efflux system
MTTTLHRRQGRDRPARMLAALALAGLWGCQSYERRPLDLAMVREQWLSRSPADETARQFADRLALAEGHGAVGEFDPSDGLTLAEAEPVALVFNRELRLARLEANVVRATADHAGSWEDPVLGVDIERVVSGVAEPWTVLGSVGLTLPVSGRLAAERARAGAEYAAELRRIAAREWATRAALRELWIEWTAQEHRSRMVSRLVDRLRTVAELAGRQEQAGLMSRVDARVFAVELAGAEAERIAAAARARELELRLRDVMGLSPGAPVQLVGSLAYTPRQSDPTMWRGMMETGSAELDALREEYEAAEHSLRREVRGQYPDLTASPGYGTDEGERRVLLGLNLPIPLWNRNRAGIAEATAAREAARGRFESAYEALASKLAVAQVRFESGRAAREAVESRLVPLADEQDAEVRRVAELGRVDSLLLLQAIRSQHEAKVRLVDARAAEAVGAIRVDELLGPPALLPPHVSAPSAADPAANAVSPGTRP